MTNTWDQSKFLEPICYPMTELETVQVLHSAWVSIFNAEPSIDSMGVLFAQWALEVGIGAKYAKCYNFGNIKSIATDGLYWTNFRCNEIIGGKNVFFDPPNDACKFRAFQTAADGAVDYIKFLSQRKSYANAWAQVIAGNPSEYAHQLKISRYYTAAEKIYTNGVVSLFNQFKKKYGNVDLTTHVNPPDDKPIEPIFTPDELAQIQGNISLSISNSLNDYFTSSRAADSDERDVDYGMNDVNAPIPMPQSVWSSIANIFKGK